MKFKQIYFTMQEEIDRLKQLYIEENYSMDECAKIMDIPRSTVYRAICDYNFEKTPEKKRECRIRVSQKLYGTDHPSQCPAVIEKMKETNKELYGVEFIGKSPIIRAKIEATNQRLYGVKSTLSHPETVAKIHQTNLEKYGSISPFGSKEIQDKTCRARIKLYGAPYTLSEGSSLKQQVQETNLKLYGSVTPFGNAEIQSNLQCSRALMPILL